MVHNLISHDTALTVAIVVDLATITAYLPMYAHSTFENVHVCVCVCLFQTPKITISHQLRVPMKMAMDKENPPNPFYYHLRCFCTRTGCSMASKCHTHTHTVIVFTSLCPPPGVHLWFIHIKQNCFSLSLSARFKPSSFLILTGKE